MSTVRSYVLFPQWPGSFSTKSADYGGIRYVVAATSIRQAYALAHQRAWIHPHDEASVIAEAGERSDTRHRAAEAIEHGRRLVLHRTDAQGMTWGQRLGRTPSGGVTRSNYPVSQPS